MHAPPGCEHLVLDAGTHALPAPYRGFAVRSEEPRHALLARAPYGRVHRLRGLGLAAGVLAALAALGRTRLHTPAFGDIDYAPVTLAELAETAATAAGPADLPGTLGAALQHTGVLGPQADAATWRRLVAARIDFLGCRGAGFHNDVARHWTACLFWNLVLAADDVAFVMPHAGLRLALAPGDLLLFDPAMAHGLCRPRDQGQALAASFEGGGDAHDAQVFLSGELPLDDAQWAALGAPWSALAPFHALPALELVAAQFDDRSGRIQRPDALRECLAPGSRYA